MLSDHERRTWRQIQADLLASDPELAQSVAADDPAPVAARPRRSHLVWVIATSFALLTLLSLAAGLPSGLFIGAGVALGALVCHLNSGGQI